MSGRKKHGAGVCDGEGCAIANNNVSSVIGNRVAGGDTRVCRHVCRCSCVEEPVAVAGIPGGRGGLAVERGVEVGRRTEVNVLGLRRRGSHHSLRWGAGAIAG
jgi:hypothetical protein